MSFKKFCDKNERIVGGVAVLVLALGLFMILRSLLGGGVQSVDVWYFDLNKQELVAGESDGFAPVRVGSEDYTYPDGVGGAAVKAAIFGCGEPPSLRVGMGVDEIASSGAVFAYVSRYPVEGAEFYRRLKRGEKFEEDDYVRQANIPTLIASPTNLKWVPIQSPAAAELLSAAGKYCADSGSKPVPAVP